MFTQLDVASGRVGTAFVVEDLVDIDRGYATGPERALMSALLFDGIQAYMGFVSLEPASRGSREKEAYNWVHTRGSDYVFSFDSVCEALGIEPDYLRYGLANAANSQTFEWKRARRNF